MSTTQNPVVTWASSRSSAAVRAADALLRALGGVCLALRVPSNVAVAGNSSELGLTPAIFEDAPVAPVVVQGVPRSTAGGQIYEVLVSASAVARQVELRDAASADDLFASALGLVYGDQLLRILSVAPEEFAGAPYLYRIQAIDKTSLASHSS